MPLYKLKNRSMVYNTFRQKDMLAERELAKYLDKHLYSNAMFTRAERTDNALAQIDGSDIILSVPSLGIENAVVDEKASIYYINKDLKTFVLELLFRDKGLKWEKGWFINDELATEYYLLQWIKADIAPKHENEITADKITEIECALINKKKLRDYFVSHGYDMARLKEITLHILIMYPVFRQRVC